MSLAHRAGSFSARRKPVEHLERWSLLLVAALLLTALSHPTAAAGPATQVKDINTGSGAAVGVGPTEIVGVGSSAYFVTDDGFTGAELWRSDGSSSGTTLVRDIFPGAFSSQPAELTAIGSTLFLRANDGDRGAELWKVAGGVLELVRDINPGAGGSAPSQLTNVNGTLYFVADNGTTGAELWRSDGSGAGTTQVADLVGGLGSANPSELTAVGGTLFFAATTATAGTELWKSDLTGTVLASDIIPGTESSTPTGLTAGSMPGVGPTLFFSADNNVNGREIWRSNGTPATTQLVNDLRPGPESSSAKELVAAGPWVFFNATDDLVGTELWKTNGIDTALVADLYPGSEPGGSGTPSPYSSSPRFLTAVGNNVYFRAQGLDSGGNDTGYELWRSDGSAAGSELVLDINPGPDGSSLQQLVNVGGTLFFSADDEVHGRELWRINGSGQAELVKDIWSTPSRKHSSPSTLANVGGTLFFNADDGVHGRALWKSNGSEAGTQLVKASVPEGSSLPRWLTPLNGTLFFAADSSGSGRELWRSDGSEIGTQLMKDISPGPSTSSRPEFLATLNNTLFFLAEDEHGRDLWSSNGAPGNAARVKDFEPTSDAPPPGELVVSGGKLYLVASEDLYGQEVWQSDGSEAGTTLLRDITPGGDDSTPAELTDVNGKLFFAAESSVGGRELWYASGTAGGAGTIDIVTGPESSAPTELTAVNGVLFFSAQKSTSGRELWKSGPNGTFQVKDIAAGPGSAAPADLVNVNGTLFFSAYDGAGGRELWRSDGTAVGTTRVKDIVPGTGSSSPEGLVNANGRLYFRANDGLGGTELWSSDGTPEGTLRVKDINPGPSGSLPQSISPIRSSKRVLFAAYEPASGVELWISDGTPEGTSMLQDIYPGPESSSPSDFALAGATPLNTRIFFSARGTSGVELWSIPAGTLNRPVTAANLSLEAHLGRPLTGQLPLNDPDGDLLAVTIISPPGHGSLSLVNGAANTFVYTPTAGFLGIDSFSFKASDGLVESALATLTINVTNNAPVASGSTAPLAVHANRPFEGTLAGSDVDSDTLTFAVVAQPAHGSLTLKDAASGAFTYTPASNFLGLDSFSFKVNDGAADSAAALVQLNVTNAGPAAEAISFGVPYNGSVSANLPASDPDSDPLTFAIVAQPLSGTLTLDDPASGAFTYTPNPGVRGSDRLSFTASDGLATSAVTTVGLVIGNAPPVARDMRLVLTPGSMAIQGRLDAGDPDGDPIFFVLIADGRYGRAVINGQTGAFTYTPDSSFNGSDSFRFKVRDSNNIESAIATATIGRSKIGDFQALLPIMVR